MTNIIVKSSSYLFHLCVRPRTYQPILVHKFLHVFSWIWESRKTVGRQQIIEMQWKCFPIVHQTFCIYLHIKTRCRQITLKMNCRFGKLFSCVHHRLWTNEQFRPFLGILTDANFMPCLVTVEEFSWITLFTGPAKLFFLTFLL